MASKKKVPVIISFEALDKISEPLRKLNQRIEATTAPVKKLRNQFSRFSNASGLSSALATARTAALATAAAVAAAGYAAYKGFQNIIQASVDANSGLSELAERTGVSLKALQEWRYVATQNGATTESLDAAVVKFSKTLSQARRGQGELVALIGKDAPFLRQLKAVNSTEKAFELFLRQIRAVPDEADKITLLTAAFGRGADELVNMALVSDDAFAKMKKERAELGLITEEQANSFRRFGDLQKKMQDRIGMLTATVASRLLPTFEKLFTRFDSFLSRNKPQIERIADALAKILPPVIEGVIWLGRAIYNQFGKPLVTVLTYWDQIIAKIQKAINLMGKIGGFAKYLIPGAAISEVAQTLAGNGPSAATAPVPPGTATAQGVAAGAQASLVVRFENAPKGVRVETKNRVNTDLDLSLGYTMGSAF